MPRPLVFLHPFPLDSTFWDDLIGELPSDREALCVDFPGFGEATPRPDASVVGVADEVATEIARLGGRAVLVGCSMGGFVAQSVAVRHPERVAGLVLTGTAAANDPPERRSERDQAIARVAADGPDAYVAQFAGSLLAEPSDPTVRARVLAIAGRASGEGVMGALAALRDRPDRRADLARIGAPTLVIAGETDPRTPRAAMQELADGIPGARLVIVPSAGHLAPMERPAEVAAHIRTFLLEAAIDAG